MLFSGFSFGSVPGAGFGWVRGGGTMVMAAVVAAGIVVVGGH